MQLCAALRLGLQDFEGAARRDLSMAVKERIQQLGFAVLAALMIVVIYNDVVSNMFRPHTG